MAVPTGQLRKRNTTGKALFVPIGVCWLTSIDESWYVMRHIACVSGAAIEAFHLGAASAGRFLDDKAGNIGNTSNSCFLRWKSNIRKHDQTIPTGVNPKRFTFGIVPWVLHGFPKHVTIGSTPAPQNIPKQPGERFHGGSPSTSLLGYSCASGISRSPGGSPCEDLGVTGCELIQWLSFVFSHRSLILVLYRVMLPTNSWKA